MTKKKSILEGYQVLDCTVAMAGPFAGQRLGDLGADVIKIEPVTGEWQRFTAAGGASRTNINASFLSLNRNKRSLAIDLKKPEGREIVHQLVKNADVFMQNYRPGVASRLGLDYETLKAINPRLVYVSISGYGADGPYSALPGQDLLLQALSGALYSTGRGSDAPQPGGTYVVDAATAYCAFEGALAALLHRERTGEGQLVEVNMLDVIVTLQMQELSVFTIGGAPQRRTDEPHAHVYIRAPYGIFKTKDSYMAVAMPPLGKLGAALQEPALEKMNEETDGFAKRDEISSLLAMHLVKRTTREWLDLFRASDIWCGPVNDFEHVVEDPQVLHNGTFVEYDHPTEGRLKTPGFPIRFKETPAAITRGAPLVGEHTREILAETGKSAAEIDRLVSSGVVAAQGA